MQAESGITGSDVSLLNFVVSDGRSLIATRYVSNTAEAPASLYYAEGSAYEREHLTGEVSLKYSAAAKALHGEEGMMEGAAGARSRQVTGKGRRGCGVAAGAGLGGWQWQRQCVCVCVCVCVCARFKLPLLLCLLLQRRVTTTCCTRTRAAACASSPRSQSPRQPQTG